MAKAQTLAPQFATLSLATRTVVRPASAPCTTPLAKGAADGDVDPVAMPTRPLYHQTHDALREISTHRASEELGDHFLSEDVPPEDLALRERDTLVVSPLPPATAIARAGG